MVHVDVPQCCNREDSCSGVKKHATRMSAEGIPLGQSLCGMRWHDYLMSVVHHMNMEMP